MRVVPSNKGLSEGREERAGKGKHLFSEVGHSWLKHVSPRQPAYRVPAILRGVVSQQILFPSLADVGGQIVAGQMRQAVDSF